MATESDRLNPWDIVSEIPSLMGKVAIVTGANSPGGIGFNIAKNLALKGAKVYVSARSMEKAVGAIEILEKENPALAGADLLRPLPLDLGELQRIGDAVKEFAKKESRLDILVNNAALLGKPLVIDKNGISDSFATNHLGPFCLTTGLLPLLKRTAAEHPGVRIINVSSFGHEWLPADIKLGSLDDFNQDMGSADSHDSNLARYCLSKLANILFTKELQKRLDSEGVAAISISVNPGSVKTDGAISYLGSSDHPSANGAFTPVDGALTPLFAAAHPQPWTQKDQFAGAYIDPFGLIKTPSKEALNGQLAADLWAASEKVLKDIGAQIMEP